jgi:two-component system response regulator DesR
MGKTFRCLPWLNKPVAKLRPPQIRALVADANPDALAALSEIVARDGRVKVVGKAPDGPIAIRIAQVLKPDLVVLDLDLPSVNGFEAANQIKIALPMTKVLVISSDDDAKLGLAALDYGADGFICKAKLSRTWQAQIRRMFKGGR